MDCGAGLQQTAAEDLEDEVGDGVGRDAGGGGGLGGGGWGRFEGAVLGG